MDFPWFQLIPAWYLLDESVVEHLGTGPFPSATDDLNPPPMVHSGQCAALPYWPASYFRPWAWNQFVLFSLLFTWHNNLSSFLFWPIFCSRVLPVQEEVLLAIERRSSRRKRDIWSRSRLCCFYRVLLSRIRSISEWDWGWDGTTNLSLETIYSRMFARVIDQHVSLFATSQQFLCLIN